MPSSNRRTQWPRLGVRRSRPGVPALLLVVCPALISSCAGRRPPAHSELKVAAEQGDAVAVSDALEALIAAGRDTATDREYAYELVRQHQEDTAATAFARAVVTGRLVQQRGLLAAHLVPGIERAARRSRELDPNFRDGAATRLLGTLYVIAPAAVLEHGDSEQGLDLLEGLVAAHPETLENHLRLAEAYIALGDHAPARPHLCRCLAHKDSLRRDEQILLAHLVADAGALPCPPTIDASP
jgi:hypothetical protein